LAFHGTFDHSLDAKNRITVPSKHRAALAGTVFLVRGTDPCISVYPEAEFSEIVRQSLAGLPKLSKQYRDLTRFFNSHADDVELDGAGRLTLQAKHLEHAGIAGREAVIAGAGDCLEIWDRAAWERYDTDLTAQAPELTESLGHPA
jgi:MraZ protein